MKQFQHYYCRVTNSLWDQSRKKKSQENILTHEDECENFVPWSWKRKCKKKILRKLLYYKRLYYLVGVGVFCFFSRCLQIFARNRRRPVQITGSLLWPPPYVPATFLVSGALSTLSRELQGKIHSRKHLLILLSGLVICQHQK